MNVAYIDKFRFEIQKQKDVSVWYAGICVSISSVEYKCFFITSYTVTLMKQDVD
jgi:hypothetical protein